MVKSDTEQGGKKYTAENIKVLEGLEGVRHRPAMYIGSTGKPGLHHLVYEVVDNSVDEAMAGFCDEIWVVLNKNGSVTVIDNGRGIPVDMHPTYKRPAVEIAVTKLHAGGKFDKGSYVVSGGLHGVGISVVAALSKLMKVKVKRNGKIYQQEYKIGKPLYDLKVVEECDKKDTGTEIIFFPDETIFSTTKFEFSVLETRFREIAFLNKGLKIVLRDESSDKKEVFHYEGGLVEFVKWVNSTKEALHKPIYFSKEDSKVIVECAVQYNSGYQENMLSFVNTINTVEGGTHVAGFKTALTRAINDYANKNKLNKDENFTGDDVREGLTVILSVKVPEPQFEGQTKTKLGNSEAKGIVDSITMSALSQFFEENPAIARRIIDKALEALKARNAAKKAKELVRRKNAFSVSGLPGKLADCSSNKTESTELFIVEGDSAGGSAKQARNKEFQAILPLKGKILNVEKANQVKVFSNEEIANLITAIGTGIGEQFEPEKLRYAKIIIMTDADSVVGETPLLLFNEEGNICHKYIGEFVDNCVHPDKCRISSFSFNPAEHKIKKIVDVVKHPLKTSLYNIKTHLGYKVVTTPYHSVFVYNKDGINTKETKNITNDDYILLPKNLPRNDRNITVDLKDLGKDYNIFIEFSKKDIKNIPGGSYVNLSLNEWKKLKEQREKQDISRNKLGNLLGIYYTVLQQWESKIDNVMPRYGVFKKYLELIGYSIDDLDFNLLISLRDCLNVNISNKKAYLDNHTHEIKLKLDLDDELSYLLGWYIGDGCPSKGKNNPHRFSICIGRDKEYYLESIRDSIEKSLRCRIILEKRKFDKVIHFNSLSFALLLKKLGLERKKASEKFVPDILYNVAKSQQIAFLRGLLQSDGSIVIGRKNKAVLDHANVSKKLMEGIVFLYRQLGILPSIVHGKGRDHYHNNILIRANYKKYDVLVGSIEQLKKAEEIWKGHKNTDKLLKFIDNAQKTYGRKHVVEVNDDFQAVKVLKVEEVKSEDKFVYDISVDLNRSFVGGVGGLTLHNTDGAHIRTLLLTFFFRFMPKLIENGNIYIAVSPLFKVRKKVDHYVYSDEELKKVIAKIGGNVSVQRFKGLGEMNADQLWETTMNPKTRLLKKVTIEDAVKADETFSKLMGDDVEPRKIFIAERASEAQIDI
jgi:DNA gyrase subunit B